MKTATQTLQQEITYLPYPRKQHSDLRRTSAHGRHPRCRPHSGEKSCGRNQAER